MKLSIIYWTSTGNTEKVAELLMEQLKTKSGVEAELVYVSKATEATIKDADLVLFGSSAMSVEEIDDSEMAPYIESNKSSLKDKRVAVFGSYDWGDGEWLREWKLDLTEKGANVLNEHLMIQNEPGAGDEDTINTFANEIIK